MTHPKVKFGDFCEHPFHNNVTGTGDQECMDPCPEDGWRRFADVISCCRLS